MDRSRDQASSGSARGAASENAPTAGGLRRRARSSFGCPRSDGRLPASAAGRFCHSCDEPAGLAQPSAHHPNRWHASPPGVVRLPQIPDHQLRGLARGDPFLRLDAKLRPGIRAGSMTFGLRPHPAKMGSQRCMMALRHTTCGFPDSIEADHEVPSPSPPLEPVASVPFTQPDRHTVRQMTQRAAPFSGPTANRAHRLRAPNPRLGEALHGVPGAGQTRHTATPTCHKTRTCSCQPSATICWETQMTVERTAKWSVG